MRQDRADTASICPEIGISQPGSRENGQRAMIGLRVWEDLNVNIVSKPHEACPGHTPELQGCLICRLILPERLCLGIAAQPLKKSLRRNGNHRRDLIRQPRGAEAFGRDETAVWARASLHGVEIEEPGHHYHVERLRKKANSKKEPTPRGRLD